MNLFAKARLVMKIFFIKHDDLRFGYISNIAMFLHDFCDITDYKKRNELAEQLFKKLYIN